LFYQSMVRSPTTAIGRGLQPLDARIDTPNQIKVVVKDKITRGQSIPISKLIENQYLTKSPQNNNHFTNSI
jgi:hypothetical protein